MGKEIRWTKTAVNDLESIHEYIAADSPAYAVACARRLCSAARSLDRFPRRGRMVPEFGRSDVRELIVGNYRLIYKVSPQEVEVLAIVHGARDLAALWEREQRSM